MRAIVYSFSSAVDNARRARLRSEHVNRKGLVAITSMDREETYGDRLSLSGLFAFGISIWLNMKSPLAQLYREMGRAEDANKIETELRRLLAYADEDHPILVRSDECRGNEPNSSVIHGFGYSQDDQRMRTTLTRCCLRCRRIIQPRWRPWPRYVRTSLGLGPRPSQRPERAS